MFLNRFISPVSPVFNIAESVIIDQGAASLTISRVWFGAGGGDGKEGFGVVSGCEIINTSPT